MKLLDASGKDISVLAHGSFESGYHTITLPASVTSGVYFALLKYDDSQKIAKIVIP